MVDIRIASHRGIVAVRVLQTCDYLRSILLSSTSRFFFAAAMDGATFSRELNKYKVVRLADHTKIRWKTQRVMLIATSFIAVPVSVLQKILQYEFRLYATSR